MFFLQAGGKSIVLDANATSHLRNQGLASTNDSPKFQHEVRLFIYGLAIKHSSFQYSVPVWDFVEFHSSSEFTWVPAFACSCTVHISHCG